MRRLCTIPCLLGTLVPALAAAQNPPVIVKVDATRNQHPINPMIYGVAFGAKADLEKLGAPLNRSGGDSTTTYAWKINAQNLAADYFYESYPDDSATAGQSVDAFVRTSEAAAAKPMITIPMIGWVAKLGPGRAILPSFSVAKYGPQCAVDPYDTDAGDGILPDCSTLLTGNDPNDAYVPDSVSDEKGWVKHLIAKWGSASAGGVPYYLMDNEPSIWFGTHRDVHPVGPHSTEIRDKVIATSAMVKALDPAALVAAPEEWGWEGYGYSGYDQQYAAAHGYSYYPDRATIQHGLAYLPWLLKEWKASGHPVDVFSNHFYPQGGEFSNDVSTATELLRNRSTRQLWDSKYVSESWIDAVVDLIPLMQRWVKDYYYPGTPVAITEYNWGAEPYINGATTQADIYGIFGREALDMATRWTVPDPSTPTYKAMQMYRNYDGKGSGFGDVSVYDAAPQPDDLSSFAATRTADGALTIMVIAKVLSGTTAVTVKLADFTGAASAEAWQLTAANAITKLGHVSYKDGALKLTVPAQSITLLVLPPG
jgi:hypothetical protein